MTATKNPAQDVSDVEIARYARACANQCEDSGHYDVAVGYTEIYAMLLGKHDRELQQAQVVGADVARLMELVYVPGAWRCPKCNLRMIASTLSIGDGGIYANNKPQECANGCGSMWRVTEREDRQEAQRFAIEQAEALTTQSSAPVVGADMVERACVAHYDEWPKFHQHEREQFRKRMRIALESALTGKAAIESLSRQGWEAVGCLNIQRWRGIDSMVNHDFDYYGDLPDGTYQLYTAPTRASEVGDWVLVPREPTEAMREAFMALDYQQLVDFNYYGGMTGWDISVNPSGAKSAWAAMIAAAPAPGGDA